MTTEQKLKLFVETTLGSVKAKKKVMIDEYEASLKEEFSKKKAEYELSAQATYQLKEEQAKHNKNHSLSEEVIQFKKNKAMKTAFLIDDIFQEAMNELKNYKITAKYFSYLEGLIVKVVEIAGSSAYMIYLDATDKDLILALQEKYKVPIQICKRNILGGLIAKIPERNLYIDESFSTKLQSKKENFILTEQEDTP